jgi:hypothetical protein
MRFPKIAVAALGALVLAVPTTAAIKALTLPELMAINSEAAQVRILEKTTFASDFPLPGVVWTRMKVQGESLRTGLPVAAEDVFLGSHEPADGYGTSEMPLLQDTRVGADAVMFWFREAAMPGQPNVLSDLSTVYRIEKGFGEPVLMGKGEGFAFPANVKLADARALVLKTHLELAAAATAPGDAGAGK